MSTMDTHEQRRKKSSPATDAIREKVLCHVKEFKTSWVNLGQALYAVWKDKLFYGWGYDKFEHYTERELGIKQATAYKLLKTYFFLEQEEPAYLTADFREKHDALHVPSCDAVNVLRLARQKKELSDEDYLVLKESVFEKGKDAAVIKRDLTALIRERKEIDPDKERQERSEASLRRLLNALCSFSKDMESLKLAPASLLTDAKSLIKKLESELK